MAEFVSLSGLLVANIVVMLVGAIGIVLSNLFKG
jgi:hypothetical protein